MKRSASFKLSAFILSLSIFCLNTGGRSLNFLGRTSTQAASILDLPPAASLPACGGLRSTDSAPNWTATGNLNVARYHHTATLLANGKVLNQTT